MEPFAISTKNGIDPRRGTFNNVKQLQQAITDYIDEHNEAPKAFKWTAKADTILEKVRRAHAVLDKMQTE